MSRLLVLFFSLNLLALSGVSDAADKPGQKFDPEKIFKQLDTNNDGKLTKEEFLKLGDFLKEKLGAEKGEKAGAFLDKMFERLDTKKQGYLTLDDFKKIGERLGGGAGGAKGAKGEEIRKKIEELKKSGATPEEIRQKLKDLKQQQE